ncbi:hypothetical protein HF292_015015 (plasmid) [Acidithiobacillus ferruginosus]|uniref:Uncharacterized protein n=2 Tax=Acidithiobacillus ferruginosus TaxID=3063951 RepID=A0ACD5IM22_9PROT|nr:MULTISPECIES: hypothetical protein [Acidithiobacillus]MBU2765892.1 hypothetical protein [Acidithiobacillus ferrivorans]MBU2823815.1 hypothetical protein [Acidithiobacillus ferrooxidans]MBU2806168.1 hypothetical protein [Acidithiobacillus ferridurans]MBU2814271.1 hypothetical protein [Acidithiobacillus ferruginosus]MBU2844620.1 hypothetical protein [Acidithiobacillus ferriphilus]
MEKKRISRRIWIRTAAMMVATVAAYPFVGAAAHAATRKKIAKAVVHYQDHPSGHKMCGMCIHFIPTGGVAGHGMMDGMGPDMMGDMPNMGPGMMKNGSCQLVEGRISPMGYCILYSPVRTVAS